MKAKLTSFFTLVALFLAVQHSFAQKLKITQGDLNPISGETSLNVVYQYNPMGVGKFDREADYLAKKKTEYNEKEAGRGDKWEQSWIADRQERFEPQFEELFNKHAKNLQVGSNPSAKYTLVVKTTFTEPGFNVYVTRKNARIDGEIWLVATSDQSNPLAIISFVNAPGRTFGGFDYDTGTRIQEAYAALGKSIARMLSK
jgi:hypothetical protein